MPKPAKRSSGKNKPWFIKVRGSYLPCSWQGWLTYVPYVYLIGYGFWHVIGQDVWTCHAFGNCVLRQQTIIANAVLTLIPYVVALVVVMTWIAKKKS
jgi:hypothetical protein